MWSSLFLHISMLCCSYLGQRSEIFKPDFWVVQNCLFQWTPSSKERNSLKRNHRHHFTLLCMFTGLWEEQCTILLFQKKTGRLSSKSFPAQQWVMSAHLSLCWCLRWSKPSRAKHQQNRQHVSIKNHNLKPKYAFWQISSKRTDFHKPRIHLSPAFTYPLASTSRNPDKIREFKMLKSCCLFKSTVCFSKKAFWSTIQNPVPLLSFPKSQLQEEIWENPCLESLVMTAMLK